MKAQKKFGGTKPKETGSNPTKNMGATSATPGVNAFKNNAQNFASKRKYDAPAPLAMRGKSAGVSHGTGGNNAHVVPKASLGKQGVEFKNIKSIGRPAGKEDNRTAWR